MKKALMVGLVFLSLSCFATTMSKQMFKGFKILKNGEFHNVSLSIDGKMVLSREIKKVQSLNDTFAWDFVYYKNALYIAAGEKGKILKYNLTTREFSLLTAFSEGTVYSIEIYNGKLYAGLSPQGKIFRVDLNTGKYSEYFDTKSKYIWRIKAKGNSLYIVTGMPGKLIKLDSNGISTVLSKKFDKHYESMVFGNNSIYVGTYPSGSIIEVKNGRSYLVYQSKHKEIKDLKFFNGKLYAICYSGNPVSPQKIKNKPARKVQIVQYLRGAIVSIDKNNVPEVLYTLTTTAPYCLSVFKGNLYIGTGHSGKILSLNSDDRLSIAGEVDEGQVIKFHVINGDLFFITSNSAKVYKMTPDFSVDGYYLSDIFVAPHTAFWGSFYFDYSAPTGTRMEFYVRAGNSDNPDISWGKWERIDNGVTPDLPATRMIQFKARLISHDPSLSPEFRGGEFYFKEANQKPLLVSAVLCPQGVKIASKSSKSEVIPPTYLSFVQGRFAPQGKVFSFERNSISFYVKAKDPNNDVLRYDFYLELSSGKKIELKKNSKDSFVTINTLSFPEGRYRFYYRVSDNIANYPDGYTIDGYSGVFKIDNTPPVISNQSIDGNTLSFVVKDNSSPVEIVRLSTDGGKNWIDVCSTDGINDERVEIFKVNLKKKPDSVLIQVYDSCGNYSTYSVR